MVGGARGTCRRDEDMRKPRRAERPSAAERQSDLRRTVPQACNGGGSERKAGNKEAREETARRKRLALLHDHLPSPRRSRPPAPPTSRQQSRPATATGASAYRRDHHQPSLGRGLSRAWSLPLPTPPCLARPARLSPPCQPKSRPWPRTRAHQPKPGNGDGTNVPVPKYLRRWNSAC